MNIPKFIKNKRICFLIIQLLAFWPVVRWYAIRTIDSSDAPWGIISLTAAAVLLFVKRPAGATAVVSLAVPVILMMLYAALFHFLPPLLRAAIAVCAISSFISICCFGIILQPGVCGLLLLSLPVVPTMQFYFGYPLRVITGILAVSFIKPAGFPVVLEGAVLNWCGKLICIDAPCSGIKMLWAGLFLTFTLALLYGLSTRKTLFATVFSMIVIIAANSLRAAALFFIEAELYPFPAWYHEGVGIAVFIFAASAIIWFIKNISIFNAK